MSKILKIRIQIFTGAPAKGPNLFFSTTKRTHLFEGQLKFKVSKKFNIYSGQLVVLIGEILIDTGSEMSLVNKNIFSELNLEHLYYKIPKTFW